MLRRLVVVAVLIGTFASLGSAAPAPAPAVASPAYGNVSIVFADKVTRDAEPVDEKVEFKKGEHVVWAVLSFDGLAPGTKLTYILRLNGDDYAWGDTGCCKSLTSGRAAFPLSRNGQDGRTIPGGAYALYVYDGDTEVARGGFGVKGGKGSDNDNDH